MQIKFRHILLFTACLTVLMYCLGRYQGITKERSLSNGKISALQGQVEKYRIRVGKDSIFVALASQTIVKQIELIKQGVIERELLKKTNLKQANEIDKLIFRIDTLLEDIGTDTTLVYIDTCSTGEPQPVAKLPFPFEKKDQWLTLKGQIDINGKASIHLKMDTIKVDVITGLNKKKEPVIVITTDNPYLSAINAVSYKTDMKKPKKYSLGLQFGYGMTKNGLSAYAGVGITRSLIRF